MMSSPIPTLFAPAERTDQTQVLRQAEYFTGSSLLSQLLNAVPDFFVVLNSTRQVVFINRSFLTFLGLRRIEEALGLRPGEALGCIHAFETEGRCGTTEFCSVCGAVRAILNSQGGLADVQECRITRVSSEALDLRVWATPLHVHGERFTIFAIADISHEKRRRALERIFFHDVMNTAGGLYGFAEVLREATIEELDALSENVYRLSTRLIDEINAQKQLMAAENNELSVRPTPISARELLQEVVDSCRFHEASQDRHIRLADPATDVTFVSDRTLLRRVLGNMLKNALEASAVGETVTLGYSFDATHVEFWVHNPGYMPRPIQLQIFQRSFTTKSAGSGLGTYSMKLLGERYLHGRIAFVSSPEAGTTFRGRFPLALD